MKNLYLDFEVPKYKNNLQERSLHIEFDPEMDQDKINAIPFTMITPQEQHYSIKESADFCQMAEISASKKENKIILKEVAIETSQNVSYYIK